MFGKLNPDEIEHLLKQQLIGRIGCHAEGLTYVVPVSYVYDNDSIYCHTFEGMKIDMMRKNPDVCFEVDNTRNLANWQSVIAWGRFEELASGPDREQAVTLLEERKLPVVSSKTMQLGSHWPFHTPEESIDGIIFCIRLTEKTGRFEKSNEKNFFAT